MEIIVGKTAGFCNGVKNIIKNVENELLKNGKGLYCLGEIIHNTDVVEDLKNKGLIFVENVEEAVQKLKESNFKKLLVISQTTYNLKLFEDIVKEIKERIPSDMQIEVKNTICNATELRQKETEEISKKVDLMIIIGGRKSSNTNKLYDISCKNCKNVIFVENKNEIDLDKILKFKKIGIMAGASTPNKSIEEILMLIKNNKK